MSVIPFSGGAVGAPWPGLGGRLVMVPPGQVPDGARVVAVVAVVPDGGARGRPVRPRAGSGRSQVAVVGSAAADVRERVPRPASPSPAAPAAAPAPRVTFDTEQAPIAASGPAPISGLPATEGVTAPGAAHRIGPGLLLDLDGRLVWADGEPLVLTRREFDLLAHLATRPGRVLTRSQLLTAAWGLTDARYAAPRTVDVHVARLRRKLGERHGAPLSTLRGVGYRWSTETKVTG